MENYGIGPGMIPYHRFGSGSESLLVLPGVMDAVGWNRPRRVTRELLARYYFRAFRQYDVWVASRPVGLSPGESASEMAERYVPLLEKQDKSHILGFTLGGAIGSYLAREYPGLVDRLVLVACGTRLGDGGSEIVRRWQAFARAGNWTKLHVDYARRMYDGVYSDVFPVLYRLCAPLLPQPERASDVVQSCEALLRYDGERVFGDINAPALVVADTDGPLFPECLQRDAASRLGDGYIATVPGSHAVYEQSGQAFADVVKRFLAGQHTD